MYGSENQYNFCLLLKIDFDDVKHFWLSWKLDFDDVKHFVCQ